jgi:hypothetical protein
MPHVPFPNDPTPEEAANPDWFREPTAREHKIGAALFAGFSRSTIEWFLGILGIHGHRTLETLRRVNRL